MDGEEAPFTLLDLTAGTPDAGYRLAAQLSLLEPHAQRARRSRIVLIGRPLQPALLCGRLLLTPGTVLGLDSDVSHVAYLRGRLGNDLGAADDTLRQWEGQAYTLDVEQLAFVNTAILRVSSALDTRSSVPEAKRGLFGPSPAKRREDAQARLDDALVQLERYLAGVSVKEIRWPLATFVGWDERGSTGECPLF